MKAERKFEFLKIEFQELYKLIERLYISDENELNLIGEKILEYIISNIYNKNILYEEKEQKIYDNKYSETKKIIKDFLNMKYPTKDIINRIISKINITKDKKIEIYYHIV